MTIRVAVFPLLLVAATVPGVRAENAAAAREPPAGVQRVLTRACGGCHGEESPAAGVRLDALGTLDEAARLDAMARAQVQVSFGLMPPENEEQPTADERRIVADWLGAELRRNDVASLHDKVRLPEYGNAVDHAALFSGAIHDKASTPARRWLVSPQIFQERVFDVLKLDDREREMFRPDGLYGITNPFTVPDRPGVRDYDLTAVDGGHFLVMQTNAAWIVDKQIGAIRIKRGEPVDAVFENREDRWSPAGYRQPNEGPFEKVMFKASPPTDEELTAAIHAQFAAVLQRPPDAAELQRYLALTRTSTELGGNVEGLRQMLLAVLLESEFVYRLEFGAGEPDEQGRKKLSPREASYAIAFALGDRTPDPLLVAAAREGRLGSREDYEREVRRLLADERQFRGSIDPPLHGQHWRSHVATHPKLVRFFREFFGYPNAVKVFKDFERSDGYYTNPDRGGPKTPGTLVNEADMIVEWHVRRDRRVFENLLGSDMFFIAPMENAVAKSDALVEVYERFKDTDWRLDRQGKDSAPGLSDEELAFLRKRLHPTVDAQSLDQAMRHVERYRARGLRPHPVWQYKHGAPPTPWAVSYGLDPFLWEFPREQPFHVPNYKGILTHPAWLIAHAQNLVTDPVRRGKWIREKLLAGIVPDVPITVDAVIPENPHQTLRERLESATSRQECWKCHRQMNPLGLAFEIYDDFGRFRTQESLEHPDNLRAKAIPPHFAHTYKTLPVNAAGRLDGTGDPALDGDVRDALDLIDRLVKSERVRQSIIRHAFRFFMGRNETLGDAQTLIDADYAYVESDGSFKAVVVSLLTSDSFMFRK